ncbi:HUS1-like protein, partial [Mya arenaria]
FVAITRVVTTISKLIKACVLRITPTALYFILSEKVVNGGIQIWCELPQGHFFDEYAMEGVSAEDNEIYLEMSPENLVKALKTAQVAKWVKIKLTKKHAPCLTVEVDLHHDAADKSPTQRDGSDGDQLNAQVDPEEFAEARIDVRKFSQFLAGQTC